jgi:hypothetical protein
MTVFLLDDLANGFRVAIAVQNQQFHMLGGERPAEVPGFVDPVAMCRVAGIAQRAVDQCNVFLIVSQDGNGNALAPVQIAFLATAR